jgi:hypothetical protein
MSDIITNLENGLDRVHKLANLIGFSTVAYTNRTVTVSPSDKSALGFKRGLIFDFSIMATRYIRQTGSTLVKVSDHVKEEYCLLITLNNDYDNAAFVYGVSAGAQVFNRFAQFICGVVDDKIELHATLKGELIRTIVRAFEGIANGPEKDEKLKVFVGLLGRSPEEIVKLHEKSDP